MMIREKTATLQVTLLEGIISVHKKHKEKQQCFDYFSRLISEMPWILDDIKNNVQSADIEVYIH